MVKLDDYDCFGDRVRHLIARPLARNGVIGNWSKLAVDLGCGLEH